MFRNLIKLFSVDTYNHNMFYGVKAFHATLIHPVEQKSEVKVDKPNRSNQILGKYDKEQEQRILEIINNYNLEKLLCYEISKGRANKLLAWRMRNGFLKNLNDIMFIEGFGLKVADKFFQSMLLEPKAEDININKRQIRTASLLTPSLDAGQKENIKSSVSLRIGVNSITWSRLDVQGRIDNSPCLLTHWEHHEIAEKKLHITELIQRCLYVHHRIPSADCYLFENPQVAQVSSNPGSVEQQNISIQKSQVIAIMGYALATRNGQFSDETECDSVKKSKYLTNIFYMKRFLSARLFNNLVGTEIVSSEQIILNMMRTFYNTNEGQEFLPTQQELIVSGDLQPLNDSNQKFSGNVQFPTELRQMFSNAPRYYRDFLSQALLLNLAFVRLILLQDAESIAAISGDKTKRALNNEE